MGEVTRFDALSRRKVFSILGLTLATSVILPSTILAVSDDAVAQQAQQTPPTQPSAQQPASAPPETGTERRQERRTGRVKRRKKRRTARQKGRTERREIRRGTSDTDKQ